jgi:hypothetical protein
MVYLVFDNDVPLAFPFSRAVAAKVTEVTFGTTFARDLVYSRGLQVINPPSGSSVTASTHTFLKQAGTTAPLEVGRHSYTVDPAVNTSIFTVGVLKRVDGVATITNALQVDAEQTVFNGSTVIRADGISLPSVTISDTWRLVISDNNFTIQGLEEDGTTWVEKFALSR